MQTNSVLLIIDVQIGLVAGQDPIDHPDELFIQINNLINKARATETYIIYVQDVDVAPFDSPDFAIHSAVAPIQGDLIIQKRAADAFYETSLQHELESRDIKHLVVAGCKTEYCIDTTCRIATNLGYDITLAGDAHATTGNGILSATQIIAHHNRVLDGFGVDGHYAVTKNTADVEFPVIWTGHHFD